MALKALDTRALTLFPMFLIPDLVLPSLCLLRTVFPEVKSKPEKDKLLGAVSRWFPTMVVQDTAPGLRDRKHKMGSFGPGSEIGTG